MVSSISDIGETGHLICQRFILNFSLTPCTKVNSKWIRYLNINFETEKFLESNIGNVLSYIALQKVSDIISSGEILKKAKASRTTSK